MLYFFLALHGAIYKDVENPFGNKAIHNCIYAMLSIVVVAQGRSAILYMLIVAAIMLLMSLRKDKIVKYSLLAIVVAVGLMCVPQIRGVVLDSLAESQNSNGGNIAVRLIERKFFEEKLVGHELFGVGIPNNHDDNSVAYSGKYIDPVSHKYNNYYLEDLGAFSIRYQFGYISYILYFILLIFGIIDGAQRRHNSNLSFVGLAFLMFMLLNCQLLAYITFRPFGFMIALIFLEISRMEERTWIFNS